MKVKPQATSILNKLPPEQRVKVDGWLFTENLSYRAVAELCARELKVPVGASSVLRYYHGETDRRKLDGLATGGKAGDSPPNQPVSTPMQRYEAVLEGIEKMALAMSQRSADDVKARDLADLVNLLIGARREANEASRVALAREKLEYDVATACLAHQLEMDRICADKEMDDGERIQAIREELFGPNLPG